MTAPQDAPVPAGPGPGSRPPVPAPRTAPAGEARPLARQPARIPDAGRPPARSGDASGDGRWQVLTSPTGAAVTTPTGTVAAAQVSEQGARAVVEFWTASPALPRVLCDQLVDAAFTHPALRSRRPVLVCLPRGDDEVLTQARRRLAGARTRVAGATCLLEGQVHAGL